LNSLGFDIANNLVWGDAGKIWRVIDMMLPFCGLSA